MSTKITISQHRDMLIATVSIPYADWPKLDAVELQLCEDAKKSESVADKMLALQTICYRIEQQKLKPNVWHVPQPWVDLSNGNV